MRATQFVAWSRDLVNKRRGSEVFTTKGTSITEQMMIAERQ